MHRRILIIIVLVVFAATLFFVGRAYYSLREIPPTPRVTVTIPEGFTVSQANEALIKAGVLDVEILSEELEGYLFPDTYEFFVPSGLGVVREKFLENFERKARPLIEGTEDGEEINILTLASIVEREVPDSEERRIVAGILWKRLENSVPLQADATICYIKEAPCLPITKEDKGRDSLYNTYQHLGLPPGPIGNPGADAIEASVNPLGSPYWYYISDPVSRRTIFARTLDEHNQNVVKYLGD